MYLRRCYRKKDGKRHAYWALVKSRRTARGPRQQVVAYLGGLEEAARWGVQEAADPHSQTQRELFTHTEPEWVAVDVKRVRVERSLMFGGAWLGHRILSKLGVVEFLQQSMARGREQISWPAMAMVLVLGRLCDPSSELPLAEQSYEASALSDLLGVPAEKVNDDRLYRALDQLLPHKAAIEKHLKTRLGELFQLEYDLLLYDVTSTYFAGPAEGNSEAKRGYSRDHRPDCKQVNIALVVSRQGLPLGYEILEGNRHDSTTVEEIVAAMEKQYGKADRIWVMDRGMASEDNLEFLKQEGRRYILGTAKGMLRKFEQDLLAKGVACGAGGTGGSIVPGSGRQGTVHCLPQRRAAREREGHAPAIRRAHRGRIEEDRQ